MLKISIFTEAGKGYGYGHLSRCTALCDAFVAFGFAAKLFCRGEAGSDWESDEMAFDGCDIVVIDSYTASIVTYNKASQKAKVCVWLDDFDRLPYPKGIVYSSADAPLLRKEFWNAPKKDISKSVKNIFINLGSAPLDFDFLSAAKDAFGEDINIIELSNTDAKGVAETMSGADLAISAAGQTLLELACMGVPSIAVITAQNQLSNAIKLQNIGFCKVVSADTLSETKECLSGFLGEKERASSSAAGQGCIGEIGALRLAANTLCEFGLKAPQETLLLDKEILIDTLIIKPFCGLEREQLRELLGWRNHESIREWMFDKEPIVWDEHIKFVENLKIVRTKAYWMVQDVGVISLSAIDYEETKADIGIYKAPKAPKGSGARLLTALLEIAFLRLGLDTLRAEVYCDNKTATALYGRFGFCLEGEYERDGKKVLVYELKKGKTIE